MAQSNLTAQLRPTMGPLALLTSSIGLKAIMAVTGLLMTLFLVGHLLGNLLVFSGPEAMNAYAEFLHSKPAMLWVVRLGLIACVTLHILAAGKLSSENLQARSKRYRVKHDAVTGYAARTMVWSGPILLLFIIYHLAHLTFGVTPGPYQHDAGDIYGMLVRGFRVPTVAYFYAFANLCLGLHLFHGLWSMFQSLGINHPTYNFHLRALAVTLTVFIAGGNIFIPLAVLGGAVAL